MTVSNELVVRLLSDYKKPEDLIGENGLLKQLTKRLVERALEAEMAEHLGHGKNEPVANPKGWTTFAAISDVGTTDSSVKLIGVLTGDVDGSWTGV